MELFTEKLGVVGAWCANNKYLMAIKDAFQNYMPATIAGAMGVLWTSVIVTTNNGLGTFFSPIMILEPLNTIFDALNTATIGMITVGVTMLVSQEIAEANGEKTGAYPAVLGIMMLMMVTPTAIEVEGMTVTGISLDYLGSKGLFTGLIVGILGTEGYCRLRQLDALKIKMPEQVPTGVARAFEVLIPTCIILIIVGFAGWLSLAIFGHDLNSIISTYIQGPLKVILGGNIAGLMLLYVITMLFWCVGIHGMSMVSSVKAVVFTPLIIENMEYFKETGDAYGAPNILNDTMGAMFGEWSGAGLTLGLIICILIFSKREDNRTIASISLIPGIFNINETMTFGMPLVLNPILDIPFILAPVVSVFVGWLLIVVGFCPKVVVNVPWTIPPVLFGFLATGAHITGAISQLISMVIATLIYAPFFLIYENQQNKGVIQ